MKRVLINFMKLLKIGNRYRHRVTHKLLILFIQAQLVDGKIIAITGLKINEKECTITYK